MTQTIQVNRDFSVRFITQENQHWFLLSDIKSVLNCSMSSAANLVGIANKSMIKIPDKAGRMFAQTFVNVDGITQIYQRSRSMNLPVLMDGLAHFVKEPNKIVYACKEVSWLRIIKSAFASLRSELQYPVGEYRVDLYFPDLFIAVECDENGHSDRSEFDEERREFNIGQALKCQFIRFNPDVKNFDIGTVIDKIFRIFCIRQKVDFEKILPVPEKSKRLFRDLTDKPCYVCKIVKPLQHFHKAKEHRDGRENVCKICRENRQKVVAEEKLKSMPENYTEKICSVCKESKQLSDFFKDRQKWDGLALKCKVCWKSRNQQLQEKVKLNVTEKTCTDCGISKNIDEFYKRKASPDGHGIYCKICARNKAKKQYTTEKKRQYRQNYLQNPPVQTEQP